MIVGIDVHKRSHAAALVDEHGAPIATLTIPNSRAGIARLCRWLSEQSADGVAVGVENAGGYGRLVCAVLAAAGHEVLNVPSWRVKRERVHQGPGKSDPGDAVAIGQCVLRHRDKLGPALEPPLIRAIALLETHRRQSVTRRTDAIQRLRAVWAQLDPEAESATSNVATRRALRHLKEIDRPPRRARRPLRRGARRGPCHHGYPDRRIRRRAPLPGRRRLRPLRRLGSNPLRLGLHRRPPPAPPRRQPAGQRLPPPNRRHPGPRRPASARLPRAQDGRRKDETRGSPSPQAPPLRRGLPAPLRLGRTGSPASDLT